MVDKKGKGLLFVDNEGTFNAPGGVKSKSMSVEQFSPANITTQSITAESEPDDIYPLAEVTPDGRVLFATDPKVGEKSIWENHCTTTEARCPVIVLYW
ncbi:hypothetical protein [Serratia marcescens]|uniref:hypothetical protein n=1 Tax=Serratia marcescens TaxID=615 RepID=UPI001E5D33CC|nr:hypothetical protein [Serratia marcescens]